MAEIAENEEKVFQYHFYLSYQTRMKIIDKLQPADRCRMTRRSKLCNMEAKTSKYYIHSLEFVFSRNYIRIYIHYENPEYHMGRHGFVLEFKERFGKKVMIYNAFSDGYPVFRELWAIELHISTDIYQYAISVFKSWLSFYQNTIKKLHIGSPPPRGYPEWNLRSMNLEIESLNNLEELRIDHFVDSQLILSKLRKPLKLLQVFNGSNNSNLANSEQVYQVENRLTLGQTELNSKQFSQLSAKDVFLSIGTLTEKDIFRFIRSWQNGTIGKNIERYEWHLKDSKFSYRKFLNLLRVRDHSQAFESYGIEIKHYIEPGRSAFLYCEEFYLEFNTYNGPWD